MAVNGFGVRGLVLHGGKGGGTCVCVCMGVLGLRGHYATYSYKVLCRAARKVQ